MLGCAAPVRRGWDTDLAQHVARLVTSEYSKKCYIDSQLKWSLGQHWGNTTSRNRQRQPTAANQQLWL